MNAHTATARADRTQPVHIGDHLREWRQRRHLSQLDLAGDAEISARHLSFVETGRAAPSRDMVLKLAQMAALAPLPQMVADMGGAGSFGMGRGGWCVHGGKTYHANFTSSITSDVMDWRLQADHLRKAQEMTMLMLS